MDRGDELLLTMQWPLAIVGVLILAGCSAPSPAGPAPSDDVRATYSIQGERASGTLQLVFHDRAPFVPPLQAEGVVVRVDVTITPSAGPSVARVVRLDAASGALVAIGDLDLGTEGSEQYRARTDQWAGSPFGPPDAYRCIAGLFLPLSIAESAVVEFPAGGTWDRASGRIERDGESAGIFSIQGEAGWPERAIWSKEGVNVCQLELLDASPNDLRTRFIHDDASPPEIRRLSRAPLRDGVPPAEIAGLVPSIQEAVDAAKLDPAVRLYLGDPEAWLVEAHWSYEEGGPVWTLVLASPSASEKRAVRIVSSLAGPRPAEPSVAIANEYSPPLGSYGPLIVAQEVWDELSGSDGTPFELKWFTAATPGELRSADAAVWQFGIPHRSGKWETITYSANDGTILARVVGPRFG